MVESSPALVVWTLLVYFTSSILRLAFTPRNWHLQYGTLETLQHSPTLIVFLRDLRAFFTCGMVHDLAHLLLMNIGKVWYGQVLSVFVMKVW